MGKKEQAMGPDPCRCSFTYWDPAEPTSSMTPVCYVQKCLTISQTFGGVQQKMVQCTNLLFRLKKGDSVRVVALRCIRAFRSEACRPALPFPSACLQAKKCSKSKRGMFPTKTIVARFWSSLVANHWVFCGDQRSCARPG